MQSMLMIYMTNVSILKGNSLIFILYPFLSYIKNGFSFFLIYFFKMCIAKVFTKVFKDFFFFFHTTKIFYCKLQYIIRFKFRFLNNEYSLKWFKWLMLKYCFILLRLMLILVYGNVFSHFEIQTNSVPSFPCLLCAIWMFMDIF